jgi:hypothetical protein
MLRSVLGFAMLVLVPSAGFSQEGWWDPPWPQGGNEFEHTDYCEFSMYFHEYLTGSADINGNTNDSWYHDHRSQYTQQVHHYTNITDGQFATGCVSERWELQQQSDGDYVWEHYVCNAEGFEILTEASTGSIDQAPSWANQLQQFEGHIDSKCTSNMTKPYTRGFSL